MDVFKKIILFSWTILPYVQSTVICGHEICQGSGAYCCDDGEGCCWKTYVYEFWWFWIIWVAVLLLILACSGRYWRRRWRERRMAVMASSQYPTYGTVAQPRTGSNTALVNPAAHTSGPYAPQQGQSNPYYTQHPPSGFGYAPSALPSYADSEASKNEKPPAYSA